MRVARRKWEVVVGRMWAKWWSVRDKREGVKDMYNCNWKGGGCGGEVKGKRIIGG